MTYFSDFDTTEYFYDDEQLRRNAIRSFENKFLAPASYETVPEALLMDLEIDYDQ
jgi:hypothetical protein